MNNNTTAVILCIVVAAAFITVAATSYSIYQNNNELKTIIHSNFREHCNMVVIYCNEAIYAVENGHNGSALLYAGALYELFSSENFRGIHQLGSDYVRLYTIIYENMHVFHNDMLAIHTALMSGNVSQDQIEYLRDCADTFLLIYQNTPGPDLSGYHIIGVDKIIIDLGN